MANKDIALPPFVPPSPDEARRARAIQTLNRHLGGQADYKEFSRPKNPTVHLRAGEKKARYATDSLTEDPQADLAVFLLQRQYPELFKGIGTIYTGAKQRPGVGGTTGHSLMGGANVTLEPSQERGFSDSIDTLRHELGHVSGLPDVGPTTAYDVGTASADLHRNIRLPSSSGRTSLPGLDTDLTRMEQWNVDRDLERALLKRKLAGKK